MRIKSPATYIILLVFVCFSAGVLSVFLRPDQLLVGVQPGPELTITPTENVEAPQITDRVDDNRITILILGVDHIADPEGKLLAIWFLTFEPGEKYLSVLGLPLDFILPDGLLGKKNA